MTNPNGYMYVDYVDHSIGMDRKSKKEIKKERKKEEKARRRLMAKPKKKIIAIILLLLAGNFGIHRFYTGRIFTGILCLLTRGFFGLALFIDGFLILTGRFKDRRGNTLQ